MTRRKTLGTDVQLSRYKGASFCNLGCQISMCWLAGVARGYEKQMETVFSIFECSEFHEMNSQALFQRLPCWNIMPRVLVVVNGGIIPIIVVARTSPGNWMFNNRDAERHAQSMLWCLTWLLVNSRSDYAILWSKRSLPVAS